MVQTEPQDPTVEDMMEEAVEQEWEEVQDKDRKENAMPREMSLLKLRQLLAKDELKNLLIDSDPERETGPLIMSTT